MELNGQLLSELGVSRSDAEPFLSALNTVLPQHGIDSGLRVAHFLAQVLHESSRMRRVEENLNYSAERLLAVFPRYFSPSAAAACARDPERIACRVYGGRMGNGSEASGDGYRYRGRGLIQLTGRDNYRAFSRWIGTDLVAEPDLVAGPYAVHSAVFYWVRTGLNDLADLDDIKRITLKINGGYHGLADRVDLLQRAKRLLLPAAPQPRLPRITHRVKATQLNLRSHPVVAPGTWRASLDQGTAVMQVAGPDAGGWMLAQVILHGTLRQGYLAGWHLEPVPQRRGRPLAGSPAPVSPMLPVAQLAADNPQAVRAGDGARAWPLSEQGRPQRTAERLDTRVGQLLDIVHWLGVDEPGHSRYRPRGSTAFGEVYACDYGFLAGVYLPRVWWTGRALLGMTEGAQAPVLYGDTVRELNVNLLHDWLGDFGPDFGWQHVLDLDTLQASANAGAVCLMVARHRDLNRAGRISLVVPEHGELRARRSRSGELLRPVESVAGTVNHRFSVARTRWWLHPRYLSFQFWVHH